MVFIYCIEDINDLKYVGSTKMTLTKRFQCHKDNKTCSSRKLNLYNAIIYVLEECSEEDRRERERYWINKLDTVNEKKLNFDPKTYRDKQYYKDEYQRNKQYHKDYNARRRELYKLKKEELKNNNL